VKYFSRLDCVQSRMCDVLHLDVMNDLGCVDSGVEIGLLQVRKVRIYVAPATVKGTEEISAPRLERGDGGVR